MHRVVVVLVLTACGRIGFDTVAGDARDVVATDATPISGLVGWWKLDDGAGTIAKDSVGSADGTLDPTVTWDPAGKFGGAADFAGDGTDVTLGTPASLTNLTPGVTISAWLKPTSVAFDTKSHCFFDKGDSGAGAGGWSVGIAGEASGDVRFDAFFAPGDDVSRVSTAGVVAVGTWTHVVATWDGTHLGTGIHLYVNGSEVGYADTIDAIATVRPDDAAIPAAIGCIASTSFAGAEDDVKVFDRPLPVEQITQL